MPKTTTKSPVNKVTLAEIRDLERVDRKVERDLDTERRKFTKAKASFDIAKRNCKAARNRIGRRLSILKGRLAA